MFKYSFLTKFKNSKYFFYKNYFAESNFKLFYYMALFRKVKFNKLIDWNRIEKKFKRFYKKDIEDKGGERPYDPVLEGSLNLGSVTFFFVNLRLDFMMFTRFELLEDYPDDTTLCKFNFNRASCMENEKIEAQFYFKAICFNLLKNLIG